jgi:hypothetical protein
MGNGFITVNRKDWEDATPEQRDWMIFNTLQTIHVRLKALEKKGLYDKGCSLLGGIIGGACAFFGIKLGG